MRHVAAPTVAELADAAAVVGERLVPTPLVPCPALGEDVHLKLETLQPTGSFKVRGGLAALSRASGPVVTGSAGNAGLGIAWAGAALGVPVTVVVSEHASPAKVAALEALPVTLIQHGADLDAAEAHAGAVAAEGGGAYVSAYNDTGVIAGQSTIGRELEAELGDTLTVAAPLGGGSLASGLGLWRAGREGIRVVAIEAARSPAFATALAAGEITPFTVGDTLADGLAGNLEPGSATFPIVRDHVSALAQVSEAEIEEAIRFLARAHGIVSEGAGAVAMAAAMTGRVPRGPGPLVILVTGRNIALPTLGAILCRA